MIEQDYPVAEPTVLEIPLSLEQKALVRVENKRAEYSRIPFIEIKGGILASCFTVAEYYLNSGNLWLAAGLGAFSLVGWRLLMGTDLALIDIYGEDSDAEQADRVMHQASLSMKKIKQASALLVGEQKTLIVEFLKNAELIRSHLQNHPEKISGTAHFLDTYLENIGEVSEKFVGMAENVTAENITNFTEFLKQAKGLCERQQRALYADEQFSLDIELDILQRKMRNDLSRWS